MGASSLPRPSKVTLRDRLPVITDPDGAGETKFPTLRQIQELVSGQIQNEIGDPSLLTTRHPASDLVHWLAWLDGRITALEAGGVETPAAPVVAEGTLEVDNYSGSFERVRDVGGILADDAVHVMNFALATVAGPGGAVYPTWNDLPTGAGAVWFDDNGHLGKVQGATGTDVTATTMRQWVKYGRDVAPGTGPTVVYARRDVTTDPAHPVLIIEQIVNLPAA
jgi:hypothetical protein